MNWSNFVKENNSKRVSDLTNPTKQFEMIKMLVIQSE